MTDPDALGPDGHVRLGAYLPLASSHRFGASRQGYGRASDISVEAAIAAAGSPLATVGDLGRRLRCTGCGWRGASIVVLAEFGGR
jgi:hypothetical protein